MRIIICILIAYLIFTSGLVFEMAQVNSVATLDIPFSYALSAERTGAIGIYTEGDINCAVWLAEKSNQSIPVIGDQNASVLVFGYIPQYGIRESSLRNRSVTLYSFPANVYIFLTDWNYRNQKTVHAVDIGLRIIREMPDLNNCDLVFQSNESKVYLSK